MTIKKNIGYRIRQTRAHLKLTQAQFAKKLDVSPQTISVWEIGDVGISADAAVKLAELADISLDWLFRGDSDVPKPGSIYDGLTPEEKRMLTAFQKASRSDQQALLRLAESVGKKD